MHVLEHDHELKINGFPRRTETFPSFQLMNLIWRWSFACPCLLVSQLGSQSAWAIDFSFIFVVFAADAAANRL